MSAALSNILKPGTNEFEIIEFALGHVTDEGEEVIQSLALNVAKVREIIPMPTLTRLPQMPPGVCGITHLRDRIIPVIDLGYFLYGQARISKAEHLIVSEFNGTRLGLVIDSVKRIHRLSWQAFTPPESLKGVAPNCDSIVGILMIDNRTIMMIDIERILAEIHPKFAFVNTSNVPADFGVKHRVMTVEDSAIIRKLIHNELNSVGFQIISLNDGQEAWELLQSYARRVSEGDALSDIVNLVITDIEMPRMDGYTLTKNIKTHEILKRIPVVIFSSMISDDNLHHGEHVGADAQLAKPQITRLLDCSRSLLTGKKVEPQLA
ncbi:MAG: chemotaxis protein [Rhodothermales bacterium]|nr:chemotaxis protein [Rhodothermales bacterium]